jgi:prepilin-type N-terminal cleavage/methylation domain-containing protein
LAVSAIGSLPDMGRVRAVSDRRGVRGFTLIEVLVAVVIVAILSALSAAIYSRYVQGAHVADAQATIADIYNAVKMYRFDYGHEPGSVEELKTGAYLKIDSGIDDQWRFTLVGMPVSQIEAVSTDQMKGGAGHNVTFEVATGSYKGYGLPARDEL